MDKVEYPLKQVLEVKQKRVEDAEKVVIEKQKILKQEQDKLAEFEAARDKAKAHHQDKLKQFRDELDRGSTSPKLQQMKAYLKVVEEKVKVEEKKVKDQKTKVDAAQKDLDEAKKQLQLKRLEVDKLETHKKDWMKERKKELDILQEKEMDEIGNITYESKQRKQY